MSNFKECPSCAAKPGTPILCESCLHNRGLIHELTSTRSSRLLADGWATYLANLTRECELQNKANARKNKQIAYLRECNTACREKLTHQHRELIAMRGFCIEIVKGERVKMVVSRANELLTTDYKVKPDNEE